MRLGAALVLALVLAGCAAPIRNTFPPLGSSPAPAGEATAVTRQQVIAAVAAAGLQALDSIRPFQRQEGPLLAAAPRTVLEVGLPDDPNPRFILIYALRSPEAAAAAARDHAAYLATNTGRIYYAPGTRFVLRQAGSTVIFFSWLPGSSPDPRTPAIEDALKTVGTEVPIPA